LKVTDLRALGSALRSGTKGEEYKSIQLVCSQFPEITENDASFTMSKQRGNKQAVTERLTDDHQKIRENG
jgi:hypothetical protein